MTETPENQEPQIDDLSAEEDMDNSSVESMPSTKGKSTGENSEFSIFRLNFSRDGYDLEKGDLRDGTVYFHSIAEGKFPVSFVSKIISGSEDVEQIKKILKGALSQWLTLKNRFALIIPDDWGVMVETPNPGDIPDDELFDHLRWALKLNGWEDNEHATFNFRMVSDDKIIISAVRDRVVKFFQGICEQLSFKLLQLSLKSTPYINLISDDALTSADSKMADIIVESGATTAAEKIPAQPPKAKPKSKPVFEDEEVNVDEIEHVDSDFDGYDTDRTEFSFKRKMSPLLLIISLVVILLGAGYWFLSREKEVEVQPQADMSADTTTTVPDTSAVEMESEAIPQEVVELQPEKIVEESPVEKVVVPDYRPFSNLIGIVANQAKLSYFSITESSVKCELTQATSQEIRTLLNAFNSTGFTSSAKSVSAANNSSSIISCKINESIFTVYSHPSESIVFSDLRRNGFSLNNGIFTGNLRQVTNLLKFIENNHILFYRLILLRENETNYRLSMEY